MVKMNSGLYFGGKGLRCKNELELTISLWYFITNSYNILLKLYALSEVKLRVYKHKSGFTTQHCKST